MSSLVRMSLPTAGGGGGGRRESLRTSSAHAAHRTVSPESAAEAERFGHAMQRGIDPRLEVRWPRQGARVCASGGCEDQRGVHANTHAAGCAEALHDRALGCHQLPQRKLHSILGFRVRHEHARWECWDVRHPRMVYTCEVTCQRGASAGRAFHLHVHTDGPTARVEGVAHHPIRAVCGVAPPHLSGSTHTLTWTVYIAGEENRRGASGVRARPWVLRALHQGECAEHPCVAWT
jgi:hypothetical protein